MLASDTTTAASQTPGLLTFKGPIRPAAKPALSLTGVRAPSKTRWGMVCLYPLRADAETG
jgi:hypothetical protein